MYSALWRRRLSNKNRWAPFPRRYSRDAFVNCPPPVGRPNGTPFSNANKSQDFCFLEGASSVEKHSPAVKPVALFPPFGEIAPFLFHDSPAFGPHQLQRCFGLFEIKSWSRLVAANGSGCVFRGLAVV
ncbi:hypothetical protein DQ04_10151000 [Trypanosoma grayi]|uniref:hypothetical protein n=1 Tax=Trypanosoma grayi TaxID=71804 RepID=UPI0004F45B8A|nr:hypothetical protein DQ04_10151000 [Trypanosoma grayi]KEG07331.1 hypothetical protein DQ04_10151000 [Trypanosoma grayi]